MKKSYKTYIIIGIVVIIVLGFIGGYNNLAKSRITVQTAQSNIDTNLQRRSDLVPQLVSTVKGASQHETDIFDKLSQARSNLAGASTMKEKASANQEIESGLSRLIAVAESNPQLKANDNFRDLQSQLEGTENRINIARRDYNSTVQSYNSKLATFPSNIIAGLFGFKQYEFFQADTSATKAPKIDFNN